MTASVYRVSRPVDDVVILQLRFPAGIRARFKAGQYLRITMPDGDTRNFSMANPPHESDGAQLHIRHVPGGRFSEGVLVGLRQGDKLEVELPYGDFYLRTDSEKPIICVATGTGFAPLKSMIEDLIKRGNKRSGASLLGWPSPSGLVFGRPCSEVGRACSVVCIYSRVVGAGCRLAGSHGTSPSRGAERSKRSL